MEHLRFLSDAFDRYLRRMNIGGLEPDLAYLNFDFDFVDNRQWHLMGGAMVKDELRELTNILNNWQHALRRWYAWNEVIAAYDQEEALNLRSEFLESMVHHCLSRPSSTRDAITFTATNAFHQVRLSCEPGYSDFLEGDPVVPGRSQVHLTRRKKEDRLAKLISVWHESANFIAAIQSIDDAEYRRSTHDYRNRHSHEIGPALGIGETKFVTRSVRQATQMERKPDGTYKDRPVPGKMSVSYSFGGTPPIDIKLAQVSNTEQYMRARASYQRYRELLLEVAMSSMPLVK